MVVIMVVMNIVASLVYILLICPFAVLITMLAYYSLGHDG